MCWNDSFSGRYDGDQVEVGQFVFVNKCKKILLNEGEDYEI